MSAHYILVRACSDDALIAARELPNEITSRVSVVAAAGIDLVARDFSGRSAAGALLCNLSDDELGDLLIGLRQLADVCFRERSRRLRNRDRAQMFEPPPGLAGDTN